MKPLILVVEDSKQILRSIRVMLELNDYRPVTASNGREALKLLSELEELPDLILCDIMMPKMDGYEFYQVVSENPQWSLIPFIFLTARAFPEDIRFGKKLGVDDYITKPFVEDDLLASIEGRIARSKKAESFKKQIEEKLLASLKIDSAPSISEDEKESVFLFWVVWDEVMGPYMKACYPPNKSINIPLESVGVQLFHTTHAVYGHTSPKEAQGVLLGILSIHKDVYIHFDTIADTNVRGGKRKFMLVSLAPKINYLESMRIKEVFEEVSLAIKEKKDWDIENCWQRISEILTKPLLD